MSATIIEFQVENVKKIKAIQVFPKGNDLIISGANDQGKSCALDALDYALRGGHRGWRGGEIIFTDRQQTKQKQYGKEK